MSRAERPRAEGDLARAALDPESPESPPTGGTPGPDEPETDEVPRRLRRRTVTKDDGRYLLLYERRPR